MPSVFSYKEISFGFARIYGAPENRRRVLRVYCLRIGYSQRKNEIDGAQCAQSRTCFAITMQEISPASTMAVGEPIKRQSAQKHRYDTQTRQAFGEMRRTVEKNTSGAASENTMRL